MYKIIIPSYKRKNIFKENTYRLLINDNIDLNKVFVYVSTQEDYESYKSIDSNLNIIFVDIRGLTNTLNYIHNKFDENEKLVIIHDDIKYFYKLKYDKKLYNEKKITRKQLGEKIILNLDFVINTVYENMNDCILGGVSCMNNPFFLSNNITNDLRLIEGCFWCCINKKNIFGNLKLFQDDIERTLKCYKENKICRINYIGYEYLPIGYTGGQDLETIERNKKVKECVEYLNTNYSNYGTIKKNKREGLSFKLNRIPKII